MRGLASRVPSAPSPDASQSPVLSERQAPRDRYPNRSTIGIGCASPALPVHAEQIQVIVNECTSPKLPSHRAMTQQPADTCDMSSSSNRHEWLTTTNSRMGSEQPPPNVVNRSGVECCLPTANHRGRDQATDAPGASSNGCVSCMHTANHSCSERPLGTSDVSSNRRRWRADTANDRESTSKRKRPTSAADVTGNGCQWHRWQPGPFHKCGLSQLVSFPAYGCH